MTRRIARSSHDGVMSRRLRVIFASVLVLAGAVGTVMFLGDEGLDRAEKWVAIAGVVVSAALSSAGLVIARTARQRPVRAVSVDAAPAVPVPFAPEHDPRAAWPAVARPDVDARESKGLQVGDHNTQHNTF